MDTKSGDRQVQEDYKNFLANFYTVAFIGLVVQWMEKGMKDQPEKIIEDLSITVRGSMLNALEQYEAFNQE